MKTINKLYILLVGLICMTTFLSCEEADNEKEWGISLVYMPQAAILNGGLDNNYPVPLNNNPATQNYFIDEGTNTMKIVLGVYRSGLQKLQSYSVKVSVDDIATANAVKSISRAVALPTDVYSLPEEVPVADGERENTFYLSVDMNKLLGKYGNYNSNKLVLAVRIKDPTRYELNEDLSTTIVVINASSFMPAPTIISGGDFEDGTESFWMIKTVDGTYNENYVKIQGGHLSISYGADPVTQSMACYQSIQLLQGVKYKLSADFTCSGTAKDGQFFFCISTNEPVEGSGYIDPQSGLFANIDTWQPNGLGTKISGTMPQVATWTGGIDKTSGEFTPSAPGQYYIIIVAACWNGSVGDITVDNLKIEEL